MKKQFLFIYIIFLSVQVSSYAMEEDLTEKTRLIKRKKNISPVHLEQDDTPLSVFEMSPVEMREEIFGYLPGNDSGLNYLIRLNSFYPSDTTVEKVETAFLQYLAKHAKNPESERFGDQIIHFFEHTQYGSADNKFYFFSDDVRLLDQLLIPAHESYFLTFRDWAANTDCLDKGKIEEALEIFCEQTPTKWDNLKNNTREVISLSEFYTIRAGILEYFKHRMENYKGEANCSYIYVPGSLCCLFSVVSISVGIPVACCFDEIVGTAIAAGGGAGGLLYGCMGCVLLPSLFNDCKGTMPDKKELNGDQEKIEQIVTLLDTYEEKINQLVNDYEE